MEEMDVFKTSDDNVVLFQLVDMLGRQAVGERTVEGFRIVLEDCEEVMSDDSHAVSTLMFRQRFFVLTLNRLLDGYHASEIGV